MHQTHDVIVCIGMNIVRERFALLDISDNYSFNFVDGADVNDIYPGRNLVLINTLIKPSFAAGGVPLDGMPINVTRTYRIELVVVLDVSAAIGILFAIVCLIFNIVFRKRK